MPFDNFSSWHVTVVSVLAGLGVGYLVGVLTAKWVWPRPPRRTRPDQLNAGLAAAIADLASHVNNLGTAISLHQLQRVSSGSHRSEAFASALGYHGDSDDEFFDIEREEAELEEETSSVPHDMSYLDQLGEGTMESEEVCKNLIEEINGLLAESPDSPELLWRLCRALFHLSMHHDLKGNREEEQQLLVKAAENAQRALELDEGVWQSHQWYAIVTGTQSKYEGTQKKITLGHKYKKHIDMAISLNSNEPNLYYLRGRWSYEVASLSWLEKKAAAAIFAAPPNASYAEALQDFTRVEELTPGVRKANLMMIAKCHIKMGNISIGLDWLHRSLQLEVVTTEDTTTQREAEELLTHYDNPT